MPSVDVSAPALDRPTALRVAGVSTGLVAVFLAIRLVRTHGATGFPVAGSAYVDPSAGLRLYGSSYDGQFVYRLALDPFTRAVTAHGITLDLPAYRQQRIGTALLAHLVAWVPGISTAWALIIVNTVAVVVAAVAAAALVAQSNRSLWWTPVLAVPACLPISLGRDLTEPVAWACILLALVAARSGRWFWAAMALTLGVLARETTLLIIGGLGLYAVILLARRQWSALVRMWLVVPLAVAIGWQLYLQHAWGGRLPLLQGAGNNSTLPVLGVVRSFLSGLGGQGLSATGLGITYLIERVVLLALLLCALWLVIRRRVTATPGEQIAWAAVALLALSLHDWGPDVQFLRATYEAWGMSVLLLLSVRRSAGAAPTTWPRRAPDLVLVAAGVVTLGVTLLYAIRV